MALVPYTITALAESDAQGTDGKNIVAGAVCSMYSQPSDTVVTLYDDAAGSNGSTSKVTGANGQVVVYVEQGRYRVNVNASDSFVTVSSDVPIDVDTFANLAASSPVQDGQRFICQERANANYILQPSGYTALAGDVTFANGRVGALIGGSNNTSITVNVPSDFSTVQDAIDFYYNKVLFSSGAGVTINIESGHQPDTGVSVSNGDYSMFTITSDDAEVTVSPSWVGDRAMEVSYAIAPIWDILLNCDAVVNRGLWYTNGSTGLVLAGKGCRRTIERGLYLNSSQVAANGCVFTDIGTTQSEQSRAVWVTRCSRLVCEDAVFSSSGNPSIYLSRNSKMHAAYCTVTATGENIILCQRGSSFNGQEATYYGGSEVSISVIRGAKVIMNGSTLSGVGKIGVSCYGAGAAAQLDEVEITPLSVGEEAIESRNGGSISSSSGLVINAGFDVGIYALRGGSVDVTGGAVTGCLSLGVSGNYGGIITYTNGSVTGSGSDDINSRRGSNVVAFDCTTTNGAISTADTNVSSFNAIDGNKGIIWA